MPDFTIRPLPGGDFEVVPPCIPDNGIEIDRPAFRAGIEQRLQRIRLGSRMADPNDPAGAGVSASFHSTASNSEVQRNHG